MQAIRKRSYKNFLQIWKYLQTEKHYNAKAAEKIARIVFDNVEADAKWGRRDARYFAARVLTAEEYKAEFGIDETQEAQA